MEEAKGDKYDYMAKVIIIGDSGVGKTNFITRFCENHFKQSYVATIGVDFKIKSVAVEGKKYKLQIWDTAGQERFKNITQTYYKGAAGIILSFSIIDRNSFTNIERWMHQIENNAPQEVSKIIVGTKSDLQDEREVTFQEGAALGRKYNLQYIESSAKTGTNVKQAMQALVLEIHKNYERNGGVNGVSTHREVSMLRADPDPGKKRCAC